MVRESSGSGERPGRACAVRLLHVTDESIPSPDPTATDAASSDRSADRSKQPKADPGPGEQFEVRAGKRERLRGEGWDPYPVSVPVTTTIAAVREAYSQMSDAEARTYLPRVVFVDAANRIVERGTDPGQIPADSDVARLQGLRPTGIPLAEARA